MGKRLTGKNYLKRQVRLVIDTIFYLRNIGTRKALGVASPGLPLGDDRGALSLGRIRDRRVE